MIERGHIFDPMYALEAEKQPAVEGEFTEVSALTIFEDVRSASTEVISTLVYELFGSRISLEESKLLGALTSQAIVMKLDEGLAPETKEDLENAKIRVPQVTPQPTVE